MINLIWAAARKETKSCRLGKFSIRLRVRQGRIPIPRGPRQFGGAGPLSSSLAPFLPPTTPLQPANIYHSLLSYLDL